MDGPDWPDDETQHYYDPDCDCPDCEAQRTLAPERTRMHFRRSHDDRILENIDRARSRDLERSLSLHDQQAKGREMDAGVPDGDSTTPERLKRLFGLIEKAYRKAAQGTEMSPLAARFRAIGDISHGMAQGDVSVSLHYIDAERHPDVGVSPFEIGPGDMEQAKKESRTSRADVNALKVLRLRLRDGVLAAYEKILPRVRDGMKERADIGAVEAEVALHLRPKSTET